MDNIKVLMFGWEFPPHISGGLGTACYGLTKGLFKHSVNVDFVVPKAYGDEDKSQINILDACNIEIDFKDVEFRNYWSEKNRYITIGSHLVPYLNTEEYFEIINSKEEIINTTYKKKIPFSGQYNKNLYDEVNNYALVASVIAKNNYHDVIHAHDWLTYKAGIEAKRISKKPLIIHVHATEFDRSGENVNQLVYDIEKEGMIAADKIITVSNLTKNIVINKYGIDANKIETVYNAVEPINKTPKIYTKNTPEKIVTFLGRVTFQKGPDYFVEAANKVLKRDSNVRFVMAGSGDMLNKMIKRAAHLRIADKFHFTGFLKGEDVIKMYSLSDVYVMPSVSEPFGISPLEAMRSNAPVIISKQSGVSEILKHAIKIDFWDIDAMADAIYGLLNYNGLSKTFIKYGKAEVDSLLWENSALKIKMIYSKLIEDSKNI